MDYVCSTDMARQFGPAPPCHGISLPLDQICRTSVGGTNSSHTQACLIPRFDSCSAVGFKSSMDYPETAIIVTRTFWPPLNKIRLAYPALPYLPCPACPTLSQLYYKSNASAQPYPYLGTDQSLEEPPIPFITHARLGLELGLIPRAIRSMGALSASDVDRVIEGIKSAARKSCAHE